jgi:hypothetical protein
MSDRTAVRKALPRDRGSTILVVVHSGSGMSRAVVPVVLLALPPTSRSAVDKKPWTKSCSKSFHLVEWKPA